MACKLVFLLAVFGVASAQLPYPGTCEQVKSQDTPTSCSNYKNIEALNKVRTELQNDKVALQNSITELEAKITQLEKARKESEAQLKEIQSASTAPAIAFSTSLVNIFDIYQKSGKEGKVLAFQRVFTNKGRDYNPDDGVFTTQTKGIYFFTFSAYSNSGELVGASLMKNGEPQVSTNDILSKDKSDGNTNTAILHLTYFDTVHVELSSGATVYDNLDGYTTFSGFLLFPY